MAELRRRGILLQCAAIPARPPPVVVARWLALLPARQGAGSSPGSPDPAATITGLALLASCARAWPGAPPLLQLAREPGGRPHWPGGPSFSIAHAAGHAVCALAAPDLAIGVDLEADGATELARLRLVTTAAERRAVAAGQLDAVALWTSKEAVLKAAGADLRQVAQVEIDGCLGHYADRIWYLQRMEPAPGLRLALASSVPMAPLRVTWPDGACLLDQNR
ncbi:MAG: 4'-phosphopantetheinyl transferase superfamily protein [Gammaproteobacteria bacterium]|nr:MAG: 4'-phosphopantetheinyl transferase superfamily protein [Gammaproteobacteria bacterium]